MGMQDLIATRALAGLSGGNRSARARLRRLTKSCLAHQVTLEQADASTLRARFIALRSAATRSGTLDDDQLVEAIAVASRASNLALGLTPYPVQILAAFVVASGHVAEMQTGEGKTLSIALAGAALSLPSKGVHVVTANDYLAARDALFLTPLAELLGFSVGLSRPGLDARARSKAHMSDVTYGTARTLGFDYLNENLALSRSEITGREPFAALLDEIDSVLLDDAATPMLVSTATGNVVHFNRYTDAVTQLTDEDVYLERSIGSVALVPSGVAKIEAILGVASLYDDPATVRRVQAALSARYLYRDGVEYVVSSKDGQRRVELVDPRTGRLLTSRLSDGLHEALENREGIVSPPPSVTRGRLSVQSYFTRYPLLGGMSGTALSCVDEFEEHYQRRVYRVPTNRPSCRTDHPDRIVATSEQRLEVLRQEVFDRSARRQPVLVVTDSVANCELIGRTLSSLTDVRVLSARNPGEEASVIARAGEPGAVTVATLMAGRGVDIVLGGIPGTLNFDENRLEAIRSGGLAVLSTVRFPAVRLDQQVRGRAGRQGEPGESRFLLSFDDELARLYAPEQMRSILDKNAELPARLAAQVFDRAQSRVEAEGVAARRTALRVDQLLGPQREELYRFRRELGALAPWPRAVSVLTAALAARLPERVATTAEVEQAVAGVWPTATELTVPALPATRQVIAKHLAELCLDSLRQRLAPLANVPVSERLALLDSTLGALVLDCLDLTWAEHLEDAVSLQTNAQTAARFGQRADRVLRSTLTSSFASRRARFDELVLINTAGLRITGLTYQGDPIETHNPASTSDDSPAANPGTTPA